MANNPRTALHKRQYKDREILLNFIRFTVENKSGLVIPKLKEMYSEERFFYESLKYVTTTKKALCKALDINIDNACRYKRTLEKQGLLVQSYDRINCPFSGRKSHKLTTNQSLFAEISKTDNAQLKMF